jgi:hypothetical protein
MHFPLWSDRPLWLVEMPYLALSVRGQIALIVRQDGHDYGIATVAVEGAKLHPDEVIIKDWGENMGIEAALRECGVIGPPLRFIRTGYAIAHVCLLNRPALEAQKEPEHHWEDAMGHPLTWEDAYREMEAGRDIQKVPGPLPS